MENREIDYKYNEDKILRYLQNYIDSTYQQHYVGDDNIQVVDVWKSMGIDEESFRSNIIKYAMRYKRKDGNNLKDLMKILHYTILLINRNHPQDTISASNAASYDKAVRLIKPHGTVSVSNGSYGTLPF
jgi:hypothetical protein